MLGANETIARDNSPRRTTGTITPGQFWRREDGTLMIFGLILFVLMLTFGGIAVDIMRYEQRRTALQQTIDRSVLAAASLSQERNPDSVVHDYFAKAGLSPYLKSVTVTEGLNFRNVNAEAEAELGTFFMGMLGHNQLDVPAVSTAEQRISNVEISLVLDVSGSMAGTKIANLKVAAKEFVETVIGNNPAGRVSVSLVPYNGQVNLGTDLIAQFNATLPNGATNVNCIDLPPSVYSTLDMSRSLGMPMTAHADTYSSTTQSTSYVAVQGMQTNETNNWCPPRPTNIVRTLGHDYETLQTQIENLQAVGATSINAGLRWGLTLLNPYSRDVVTDMISAGHVSGAFAGRPFDFTDEEALKVIVLMTDGAHFAEDRVTDSFKAGTSPIYYNSSAGAFAIRHTANRPSTAGTNEFWYPATGTWGATASSGYTQQTWPQVWSRARLTWVAWQLYARALGTDSSTRTSRYNAQMAAMRERTPTTTMDSQLNTICSLAKTQKVVIYGIAFEAPTNGKTVISNCSTSPAHYFDASGLEIQTAFRAIASNISQLRLTQ